MKDKLEIYSFNFVKKILLILPKALRYKLGELLGIIIYYTVKSRRRVTYKNLKIAFPEKDKKEIRVIAKKSYENIAKSFLEILWLDKLKIDVKGKENLDKALKKEKGAILLSLHLDNWELAGAAVAKKGYDLYGVAKKQHNEEFNKIINKIRESVGIKIVQQGKGRSPRKLIKAIKNKGVIGLISDQYVDDVEVEFFSKKTKAPSGAATFQRKFEIPVVPIYAIRNKDNSHTVYIEPELKLNRSDDSKKDIQNNTQKCMNKIQEIIKKKPEQWFWQHKRWRD
ncbi:MAG: lysophospholipid acyltransferase family protein [Fusobacteriota bacterium]